MLDLYLAQLALPEQPVLQALAPGTNLVLRTSPWGLLRWNEALAAEGFRLDGVLAHDDSAPHTVSSARVARLQTWPGRLDLYARYLRPVRLTWAGAPATPNEWVAANWLAAGESLRSADRVAGTTGVLARRYLGSSATNSEPVPVRYYARLFEHVRAKDPSLFSVDGRTVAPSWWARMSPTMTPLPDHRTCMAGPRLDVYEYILRTLVAEGSSWATDDPIPELLDLADRLNRPLGSL